LGRGRGKVEDVLKQIKSKSLVVAITSDILFPPSDHTIMVENIPNVEYHLIDSDFGHDGFLVEHKQLNDIILNFLKE
jgi:homoserine O-acetyltransferase